MWGFNKKDLVLIFNFLKMNIRDRYLASSLGVLWAIVNPLFMLSIFTFVFGYVYKSKAPGAETTLTYAIWMISGYGPWLAISEGMMASTTSVVSASGLIKNMSFKSEVLPIAGALTSLVSLSVSMIFLTILLFVDGNIPTWHIITIPVVIGIQLLLVSAIGLFLSAINVFIRDVGYALPNFVTVLLFATPIFYRLEGLPRAIQVAAKFNPFYILAESYRQPLIHHELPHPLGLAYVLVMGLALTYVGLRFFRRVKGHFEARL
jgi:lipopolysaccharide transport system permease protein